MPCGALVLINFLVLLLPFCIVLDRAIVVIGDYVLSEVYVTRLTIFCHQSLVSSFSGALIPRTAHGRFDLIDPSHGYSSLHGKTFDVAIIPP